MLDDKEADCEVLADRDAADDGERDGDAEDEEDPEDETVGEGDGGKQDVKVIEPSDPDKPAEPQPTYVYELHDGGNTALYHDELM